MFIMLIMFTYNIFFVRAASIDGLVPFLVAWLLCQINIIIIIYLAFENVCLNDDCIACTAITDDCGNKPTLCYVIIICWLTYLHDEKRVSWERTWVRSRAVSIARSMIIANIGTSSRILLPAISISGTWTDEHKPNLLTAAAARNTLFMPMMWTRPISQQQEQNCLI